MKPPQSTSNITIKRHANCDCILIFKQQSNSIWQSTRLRKAKLQKYQHCESTQLRYYIINKGKYAK